MSNINMNVLRLNRKIEGANFECTITPQRLEVWGPCNMLLRIEPSGEVYCNLHEAVEKRAVQAYAGMVSLAADAARRANVRRKAVRQYASLPVFKSPDLLAECFLKSLALYGVDLREVAHRNAARPEGDTSCASHDFCDANMAMLEAAEELGVSDGPPDTEDELKLWDEAWAIAQRRMSYLLTAE